MQTPVPRAKYNVQLIAEDMADQGLNNYRLAQRARLSDMTILRFLRGEFQTGPTAKKIARALGHKVRRYLISADSDARSEGA